MRPAARSESASEMSRAPRAPSNGLRQFAGVAAGAKQIPQPKHPKRRHGHRRELVKD